MSEDKFLCLFCLKENSLSDASIEHIIPQALLSNPNVDITLADRICKKCNNTLGASIDADFVNNPHVLYLKNTLGSCFKDSKLKEIKEKAKLKDNEGNVFDGYRVINHKGIHFYPTEKPAESLDGGKTKRVFIRKIDDIKQLASASKGKYKIVEVQPIKYFYPENTEDALSLKIELQYTRFITKMALAYIALRLGDELAYSPELHGMRSFILGKIDKLPDTYKGRIRDMEVDVTNPAWNTKKHNRHLIGITNRNEGFWYFYFYLFNITEFCLKLPDFGEFREVEDEIIISLRPC
ncbi:MAG: HNH endonuclease [Candidatus Omnitrophota bacterium]